VTAFVIVRVRGPAWDHQRPMREQDGCDEHARFMAAKRELRTRSPDRHAP